MRGLVLAGLAAAGLLAAAFTVRQRLQIAGEVRELAADMGDELLLLRGLPAGTVPATEYELTRQIFLSQVRLIMEEDEEGRLLHARLPNGRVLDITQKDVMSYLRWHGGEGGFLERAGLDRRVIAGLGAWEAAHASRLLAAYALALRRLPRAQRAALRFGEYIANADDEAALYLGRVHSLRYIRRQSRERGGAAGSEWGSGPAAEVWEQLMARHGRALWRQAAAAARPTDAWVTGAAMAAARDRVLAGSGSCPEAAADLVQRARGPWALLAAELEQRPELAPLSPYAAETLVEALGALAAGGGPPAPPKKPGPEARLFREVAARAAGLDLRGARAPKSAMKTDQMPGGMAVLDYDDDGRPDLFFCDFQQARLYRNLGSLRFRDVTLAAGLQGAVCRNGTSSADYDNDGWPDLLTLYDREKRDHLYRNERGRFRDVTAAMGLSTAPAASMSAMWFDYDRDGRLDFLLASYGDMMFQERIPSPEAGFARNGLPKRLYRNLGTRFEDATSRAGITDTGWALEAAGFDYDNDGWPDLLISNDFGGPVLYRNQRDGTFQDATRKAGLRSLGNGMGLSVADFDRDGDQDIYLTYVGDHRPELSYLCPGSHPRVRTDGDLFYRFPGHQSNVLYRNRGDGTFADRSDLVEDVPTGWGWNGMFLDASNSGQDDIFLVNGWWRSRLTYDQEANVFFRWDPERGRFLDISARSGVDFAGNSRVSAAADLDGDGCLDLVVTGFHDPRLFQGLCPKSSHWLALRLVGARSNRDGINARVQVSAGGLVQTQELGPQGGGFENSLPRRLHFGLGAHSQVEEIAVSWPSGLSQKIGPLRPDRLITIREGETP
ncbi:MAG: CRTAC1 family protein [Elusimicrobia bacterium]|nr:CRTAC1 family protein [Elusimicrobiota bacterium]